jgi:fructokinase
MRLGVDLGGSKIEAALLDRDGAMAQRHRVATPAGDYDAILAAVRDLCDQVEAAAGASPRSLPLGIGTPGSRSPVDGRMRNCNSTALNGRRLHDDLETRCGRAVRLANDADCFALSEAHDGAGRGARCVLGLILGTGVGGGVVIGGQLLAGPNAVAGEWGHNALPLERAGGQAQALQGRRRNCYCGRANCVETWLSGPGLAQTHFDLHGLHLEDAQLYAAHPDDVFRRTLDVYADMLGAALATVVNILDPDVIVLGGGLSNISYIATALPAALASQVFSDCQRSAIRTAQHGDSSGVRGAARLWP